MAHFDTFSLKNKIFFSILAVILIISVVIAFLARWILVSSLISELELRGIAIARTIAERGSSYVLDKDLPRLLSLIYDEAQLSERKHLIAYIFIVDQENKVLAHTFTRPFPQALRLANPVPADQDKSVLLIEGDQQSAHDIAIPMREGIYRLGTVHVGLNKNHIDKLVATLRFTFLGFISAVIVIIFLLSLKISKYITSPISQLTTISDELSRGNFDFKLDLGKVSPGWAQEDCPAFVNTDLPCWHFDESMSKLTTLDNSQENPHTCTNCVFYRKRKGDEVVQLADSFYNMVWSIKLYRTRLHESEEKYRSLFDSGPNPIFVVDYQTRAIIDANPRAVELYGYSKDELVGMPFLDLGPEHYKGGRVAFGEMEAEGESVYYPKVLHYKKGEKPLFVDLHASFISYKRRPSIIVAVTDLTEALEREAQVIQASKMKSLGEMSAGIAHELNQPLNAIKMGSEYLALLVEKGLEVPKEQFHQVVTEISTQVDRAADIITTLRAFGRKADPVMEKININTSIRVVLSIVGRQFELDNIKINLDLGEGLPLIMGHNNRLQQVFFNLVTNARDAILEKREKNGPAGVGIITIRSHQEGQEVIAEVSDNGAGIPDSVKDKIFEPFFTTKETSHDMGLGLAITYGITKDHHADILIQSIDGLGTTFKLVFPAAA
ncbi:MAG: PAS domain S-box protein [Desulfarculus sp.]|nr:PAS domain S-box protein [Desulfarculus sp.]